MLSPIFFIILLADISEWTEFAILEGFADDMSITVTDDTIPNTIIQLEQDAVHILQFMASNLLIANESKTTLIFFGKKPSEHHSKLKITVGKSTIEEQDSIKLLGLNISQDLKWDLHVNHLITTLNHRLYLFRHVRNLLPKCFIPMVADALVMSHTRYAIHLFTCPRLQVTDAYSTLTNKLQIAQNKMIRAWIKVKKSDMANMETARKELGILSINQTAVYTIISETRKILKYNTIPWIRQIFLKRGPTAIQTRSQSSNEIRPLAYKTEKGIRGFIHQAARSWNTLTNGLKDISSNDETFKKNLKTWIKDIP